MKNKVSYYLLDIINYGNSKLRERERDEEEEGVDWTDWMANEMGTSGPE